ncbi:hypothetical protein HZA96_01555 [Candidatus Woesearchaeota archaeon]|nr:hypothetical protein [Candidatus Woesearchaeota archaeon]
MLISNTSTLILLAKVNNLKLFLEKYGKVEIPNEVHIELMVKSSQYDTMMIRKEIECKNILIIKNNVKNVQEILGEFNLDLGEAAAYMLYEKNKHKAILTDDYELIKLCRLQEIPFLCAMAIIVKMYEDKYLSKEEAETKIKRLYEVGRYSKMIKEYYLEKVK